MGLRINILQYAWTGYCLCKAAQYTVELQLLEHLLNHEIMFEKGVVRVNEYLS